MGTRRRLAGVALGTIAVAATLMFMRMGGLINDVTTDTADPPVFDAVVPLRPRGSNPVEYAGEALAARQAELYPDIQPLRTSLSRPDAFARALQTARAMSWEVVAADPDAGTIEAVDTTRFLRFKDDIAIRVRDEGTGSRIDIRSRSRVGRGDLGKNAARIREFMRRFAS